MATSRQIPGPPPTSGLSPDMARWLFLLWTQLRDTPTVTVSGVAYANLPTAVAGMIAYITDSTTATWGATIAGGGANPVLGWYNGTNWTVAGA